MKNRIKPIIILLALILMLVLPYFVFAQNPALDNLNTVGSNGGYMPYSEDSNGLAHNAGLIANVVFSILGIIFIALMLYAGYNWMTAAGDQAKVSKAQDTIRRAIIGLVIMVGAYAITSFVLNSLLVPK